MPLGSRQAVLEELRARVAALEQGGGRRSGAGNGTAPLGISAIDGLLPGGGLPIGSVHEIVGEAGSGAAAGFAAALLVRIGRLAGGAAPVLWCLSRPELYGPGLAALGVDPARLVVAQARARADLLWAAEEGLRCPALLAVVAEMGGIGIGTKDSRRFQLAAEAGGVTGFLLREDGPSGKGRAAPAALGVTTWRVAPAPREEGAGKGVPRARWRLELARCRGGGTGSWVVDWDDGTGDFAVAAELPDRPHHAGARRGEGGHRHGRGRAGAGTAGR
jgi:protein ImuA